MYNQFQGKHYWSTAGTSTAGNAISFTQAMTLDASGRLGIGTTSPTTALNVLSAVNANIGNVSITSTDNDASGLSFKVRSSPSDPTNSRSWMLHNNYSAAGTFEILRSTTATGNPTTFALKFEGSTGAATFSSNVTVTGVLYTDVVATRSGTAIDFRDQAAASIMYLDATNKRVGIGTTSPDSKLTVQGSGYVIKAIATGSDSVYLQTVNGSYDYIAGIATSLGYGLMGMNSNHSLAIMTNGSERMRITSGGTVLIGTTTEEFAGGKLQVAGAIRAAGQFTSVLSSSSFAYFDGSGQVVSSASSASALYLDTTWNTTGNPDGIYLNVTNTASGASSKLLNLKVGSVSQFSVSKAGAIQTTAPSGESSATWKLGNTRTATCVPGTWGEFSSWFTGTVANIEINGTTYTIPVVNAGYC
jgi:hypothetical protein